MTNIDVKDKLNHIMSDKEEILSRCFFNLLPKGYKERKGGMVTVEVTDTLELEFKIDISDVMADANVVMFEDVLNYSGVKRIDLIDSAMYNTPRKLPPRFDSLFGILGMPEDAGDCPLYCLTNEQKTFGAGTILYDNMYEKLSGIVDDDFIIIPSSVHELIIVPNILGANIDDLTGIIKEVNLTTVAEHDILSDRPYRLTPAGELIEA